MTGGEGAHNLSDEQLKKLVESLNFLHEGEMSIPLLVACGERAIWPLRQFLLYGQPESIFIPRQRAVWALAELGAKDVLLEYLAVEKTVPDPVIRQGEDAVENTAARALAAWCTDDVFDGLLRKLAMRCLPGVIETLGQFQRMDPLPYYILSLEDDFCRRPAEEAISKLGALARPNLINALRISDPLGVYESPSSLCRRRSILKLLLQMKLSAPDWKLLSPLLYDDDPEITARASAIALSAGGYDDKRRAVQRLLDVLPQVDWLLQGDIEDWLTQSAAISYSAVVKEIGRREAAVRGMRSTDNVLRILLEVTRRIETAR
jgi:hypothetical protein